jgi:hypothetical protein
MKWCILAIMVIGFAASLLGCANRPRPVPGFKEILPIGDMLKDPREADRATALLKAIRFTPREMDRVLATGEVHLLLGAAMGAPDDSALAVEVLRKARSEAPSDPETAAALVYWLCSTREAENGLTPELSEALARWRALEPDNSVPYYVEAGVCARAEHFDQAVSAMAEASRHRLFHSYGAALRLDLIAATDYAGYPKFTGRFLALSCPTAIFAITRAGRLCLNWDGANAQVGKDCLIYGRRIEAESKLFMEALIGLTLQSAALNKFPQLGTDAEAKNIQVRLDHIRAQLKRFTEIQAAVPEDRWLAYFDDLYATN